MTDERRRVESAHMTRTQTGRTRSSGRLSSVGGVLRVYACMLPLAALIAWYLLFAVPFTASSEADLAHASYGRPFAWLTQDLSRYAADEYPVTIAYTGTRNWSDPIVTDFDWLLFAANTAIVCVGVTAVFYALVPVLRRLARVSGRRA